MTYAEAEQLLNAAGVFFDIDEEDDPEGRTRFRHMLNMNDVWAWASADGEAVPDEKIVEVATLFYRYGWCGILYWVSRQNNDFRSEFHHYNRMIDFVANEERIRSEIPDETKRAYHKTTYTIGPQQ